MSEQQGLGTAPPLSAITFDNQAGTLWIVTILATIYVILSALVRVFVKWSIYGVDDYILFFATVVCVGQSSAIFVGLSQGLSRFNSITTSDQWAVAGKSFIASEILTISVLCLAKCSTILLMHRVFSSNSGWKIWLRVGVFTLSAVWGLVGMVAIPLNCNTASVLTNESTAACPAHIDRWRVLTITDIITEVFIFILPVAFTWQLQMPVKKKVQVLVAFAFRLPVVLFSALHLVHLTRYPKTDQPLYSVTNALVYQQAMLLWSLVSATIPNLKAFMKSFSMDFGLGASFGGKSQKSSDYPLHNLTIGSAQTKGWRKTDPNATLDGDMRSDGISTALRPDPHQHNTTVVHQTAGDGASIGSHGSQDLIIRKVVDWHVRSESSDRDRDRDELHV